MHSGNVNQELGKIDNGESEVIHLDFPTSNCPTSRFFPTSCKSCKDGKNTTDSPQTHVKSYDSVLNLWQFAYPQPCTDIGTSKVECIFLMVIVSILLHAEFGPDDHWEDAPTLGYNSIISSNKGLSTLKKTSILFVFEKILLTTLFRLTQTETLV